MKIKIYLYQKETKYTQENPDTSIIYDNVKRLWVEIIPKEKMLKSTDEEMIDEYNEYLIIEFNTDESFNTATYRNSHTECFKMIREG